MYLLKPQSTNENNHRLTVSWAHIKLFKFKDNYTNKKKPYNQNYILGHT